MRTATTPVRQATTTLQRCTTGLIGLLMLCAGCAREPTTHQADDPPSHRIVSLVPAATEMLFEMGAGPEVVGVSSFDRFPSDVASLPKVGALVDPDFERILTLRPTVVVVYESQTELIERLTRASIAMYRYRHAIENGLADIPRTVRALGTHVGRVEASDAVADRIERELDDVRARVHGRARPRTALVFGREPGALRGIYASGGVGFLHDVLVAAGGDDVFGDIPRESLQASAELMLTRQPDVIIELRTAVSTPEAVAAERAVWQRLAALPAVKAGRIYILTEPALSIPGPRIAAAARAFADVIHPGSGR